MQIWQVAAERGSARCAHTTSHSAPPSITFANYLYNSPLNIPWWAEQPLQSDPDLGQFEKKIATHAQFFAILLTNINILGPFSIWGRADFHLNLHSIVCGSIILTCGQHNPILLWPNLDFFYSHMLVIPAAWDQNRVGLSWGGHNALFKTRKKYRGLHDYFIKKQSMVNTWGIF